MGLAESQRLLARLATDGTLRERFIADPNGVGQECGLSSEDIQGLSQIPASQMAFYARSLQNKRLGEVRKLLPLTYRALGLQAAPLFRRYADAPMSAGPGKHRTDALGFAAFLHPLLRTELDSLPWLPDVLRYELGWLKASEPDFRFYACLSRYALPALFQSLEGGQSLMVSPRPTLLLWARLTPRGPVRHKIY